MITTATIAADDYRQRFSTGLAAEVLCGACPNFGCCWNCPPFEESPFEKAVSRHKTPVVVLALVKTESHTSAAGRACLEEALRTAAGNTGGTAFGTGGCRLCNTTDSKESHMQADCARAQGQPCRHPGKAIPSLEACGFNLDATASELLSTTLHWHPEAPATFIGAVVTEAGRAAEAANIITSFAVDTTRQPKQR